MSCSLAVGLLGAAPRARPALEDKVPDLKAARQGARARLGRPACQAVLADFKDHSGRPLDEVLGIIGRTAEEQLDRMVFESGFGRHGCARSGVVASTRVHSSVALICLRPFELLRPAAQEAVLIHEMLHSLGLGENPPESVAITQRVMMRCGH
jgi:hypothetical protein